MIVRFDDSLPILAQVVTKLLGKEAMEAGVALRDATGRLAFFVSTDMDEAKIKNLSASLRAELGVYARTDRVVAGSSDFGVQEILKDPSILRVKIGDSFIRLVDRRLVGIDWLRKPAPVSSPPPRFVFASLKGGVGRSTALSIAAADFASHGRRVLAIDLDMEAPGLGAMLLDEGTLPEFGLIDALVENGFAALDESFFTDLVGPSALADRRGKIDVVPAFGRRSIQNPSEVLAKIARAYAEDIQPDGTVATILDQVSAIVNKLSDSKRYDAILIDARAGLHETTASAILGLGAEVFLFGLDEPQTFQGYSALFGHLARFIELNEGMPEWLERLTFVQGKAISNSDNRSSFAEKCKVLYGQVNPNLRSAEGNVRIALPAAPFSNVPWDDEASDKDVLPNELWLTPTPLAIIDDPRFRQFDPAQRRDLLTEEVYKPAYQSLLDTMNKSFLNERKNPT